MLHRVYLLPTCYNNIFLTLFKNKVKYLILFFFIEELVYQLSTFILLYFTAYSQRKNEVKYLHLYKQIFLHLFP